MSRDASQSLYDALIEWGRGRLERPDRLVGRGLPPVHVSLIASIRDGYTDSFSVSLGALRLSGDEFKTVIDIARQHGFEAVWTGGPNLEFYLDARTHSGKEEG